MRWKLQQVVRGQNRVPNESYLDGAAPNDVAGNATLVTELEEKNEDFVAHNAEEIENREGKLREAGYFRVMLDRPLHFARGFKPRWSDEVHTVETVDFDTVINTQGKSFKTKFTLPVEGYTDLSKPRRMERGGSEQTSSKQRRLLQTLADEVFTHFGEGRTVSLTRVAAFLSTKNFRNTALEAKLNMSRPVASFLRAFPEKFRLVTRNGGVNSVRILPPVLPGRTRLRRVAAAPVG